MFNLPAGRHAIFMYAGTGHLNANYNTKYNYIGRSCLGDTLCRFAQVNHDLTTQLSTIITGLLTSNFACYVKEYFKDGRPKLTCQSQNALCGIHSDI